jgi:hypothetical protein
MLNWFGERRPALVINTVKAVAVIGTLSLLAAHWLASGPLDRGELTRLASEAAKPGEPSTTGSIARAVNATRLDPCVSPKRP